MKTQRTPGCGSGCPGTVNAVSPSDRSDGVAVDVVVAQVGRAGDGRGLVLVAALVGDGRGVLGRDEPGVDAGGLVVHVTRGDAGDVAARAGTGDTGNQGIRAAAGPGRDGRLLGGARVLRRGGELALVHEDAVVLGAGAQTRRAALLAGVGRAEVVGVAVATLGREAQGLDVLHVAVLLLEERALRGEPCFQVGLGLTLLGARLELDEVRDRDGGEDADDGHDDHQLDEREATVLPGEKTVHGGSSLQRVREVLRPKPSEAIARTVPASNRRTPHADPRTYAGVGGVQAAERCPFLSPG